MASHKGDACYFPRDIRKGSYGGDVHCLQQFLANKVRCARARGAFFLCTRRVGGVARRQRRGMGFGDQDGFLFPERWVVNLSSAPCGQPLFNHLKLNEEKLAFDLNLVSELAPPYNGALQGLLMDEPTGYCGEKTMQAARKWQVRRAST